MGKAADQREDAAYNRMRATVGLAVRQHGHPLYLAQVALDAVPDGWAKVDGEWFRITADGVGYGEFDRDTSPPSDIEAPGHPGRDARHG